MKRFLAYLLISCAAAGALAQTPQTFQCECQQPQPTPPTPYHFTCSCLVPRPPAPDPEPARMKWTPGHYMILETIKTSTDVRARHMREIAAIANEKTVQGVKLWIYWGAMEGAKGDYSRGFAIIDQYLDALQRAGNKKLILSIQDRIFGGYDPAQINEYFPAYVLRDYGKTEGRWQSGQITMPRMWQAGPMDRYIAMLKAIAARYDAHPNLEMVQTEETSVSIPSGTNGYTLTAYGAQVKRLLSEVRPAFVRTQLRLSTNFYGTDAQMLEMLQFANLLDVAVGGPDVIPNQTIQANRIFNQHLRGKAIWVCEVATTSLGGKEGSFTAEQLYDTCIASKPAYFLWIRNNWSGGPAQRWDTGILPFIRSIDGAVDRTCPANVEGCR